MPKFNGKLMFDITIEEQDSQKAVDKISAEIIETLTKRQDIADVEEVDQDIEETDESDTSVDSDG